MGTSRRGFLLPAVLTALAAALAAALAGCGGGSAGRSGSKGPIKIAWMGAETGEDATKDRHYAIDLAVADINAKGGINGRKIEYKAYDAGLTPEQGVTAVKKALSEKPTAIVGLPVTAQIKATAPLIKQAGIPTLHNARSHTLGKEATDLGHVFRYGPTESMETQALADYIVKRVKPTRVGLLASTNEASQEGARLVRQRLNAGGITDIVERKVPQTATDLTESVLAMRGAQATITWSFPTVNSLFLRQRRQNGLTAPQIDNSSGASVLGSNLNSPAELSGYNYATACDPDLLGTPEAKAYVSAWQAKHGPEPTNPQLAQGYDAFHLVAEAVRKAGSSEPKKMSEALRTLSYKGACGTYRADEEHDLFHSIVIINAAGGKAGRKLRDRYDDLRGGVR